MARTFKTGVLITGDASGAVKATNVTKSQLEKLNATTRSTATDTKRLAKESKGAADSFFDLKTVAAAASVVLGGMGIRQLYQDFRDVAVETDRLRGALVTAAGSSDLATKAFQGIEDFARTAPFTLDQSVEAFIKMRNLGLMPTEEALTSFGNTAAAMGKQMSQMIEAVADASTFEFERLKEFGIKAKQQKDTVTFTFQGVATTVEKSSEQIVKYLQNIGEVSFAGAMEEQMGRLPGLFANLEDATDSVYRKFADAGAIFIFQDVLRAIIEDTNETANTMDAAFEFMVGAVEKLVDSFRVLQIMWVSLQAGISLLAGMFLKAVDMMIDGWTQLLNLIPGVDIKYDGSTMEHFILAFDADFKRSQAEIHRLLEAELPSEQWEKYIATVRTRAEEAKAETQSLNMTLEDIVRTTASAGDASEKFSKGLKKVSASADELDVDIKKLAKSMEQAFADMLAGTLDGFEKFFDQVARMARQAGVNFILQQLGGQFAFGGGAAGGGGGLLSAGMSFLGGAQGSGLFGGAGGLGGFAGGMFSNVRGFGDLFRVGGQMGAGGMGPPTPGVNWQAGLTSLGAGILGGAAGNWAGQQVSNKEAQNQWGAAAGAAIGTRILPGWGTLIGAFVGALGDVLWGVTPREPRFNLAVTDLPPREAFAREDINKVTRSAFGGVSFQSDKDLFARASQSDAQALYDLFDAISGLEDTISGAIGAEKTTQVGALVGTQANLFKKGSLDFAEFFVTRFNLIFDAIGGDVDKAFDKLAARLGPDEFLASLEQISMAALMFGDLTAELDTDIFSRAQDAIEDLKKEQWSLVELYEDQTAVLIDLATAFDGSADSIASLSMALGNQRTVAGELAFQYFTLGDAITAGLGRSMDYIRQATMSDEELYNLRREQISDLFTKLQSTIDPNEIALLVSQIDQLSRSAFGALKGDQQTTMAAETLTFLQQVETTAQERLAAGLEQLRGTEAETVERIEWELFGETVDAFSTAVAAIIGGLEISVGDFGTHVVGLDMVIEGFRGEVITLGTVLDPVVAEFGLYMAGMDLVVTGFQDGVATMGIAFDPVIATFAGHLESLGMTLYDFKEDYGTISAGLSDLITGYSDREADIVAQYGLDITALLDLLPDHIDSLLIQSLLGMDGAAAAFADAVAAFDAANPEITITIQTSEGTEVVEEPPATVPVRDPNRPPWRPPRRQPGRPREMNM